MRACLILTLLLVGTHLGRAQAEPRSTEQGTVSTEIGSPSEAPYPPLDAPPSDAHAADAQASTLRAFAHPTVDGLLGGVHVVDAASGWPRTFRVGLHADFFRKNGFLVPGDHVRHGGAALNVSVTPLEHLELAANLATYSTQSRATDPQVLQVIGDIHLFAKGYAAVLPWLVLGGDTEVSLLNGVGRIGLAGSATSVGLRASATADLRAVERVRWPLIARVNVRYLFDNSGRLVRDTESARYASLATPAPEGIEYRHLVSASERYALQVNRVDRLGASLGVEVPLAPSEHVRVHPLVEWGFALPVNRQGFDCVVTTVPGERERCLKERGFAGRPSVLTLGVRAQPYVEGLALLLAMDIATTGHKALVRELAPTPRWLLQLGISYAYDPRPVPAPRPSVERVEIPTASVRGHIVGRIVESQTGTPVAGAAVHFEGTELSDVLSDEAGAFRSAELSPGAHGMRVRAEGYREALCVAVVPTSGDDVSARCELAPAAQLGKLHAHVTNSAGRPIAGARLALHGPGELTLTSGRDGSFEGEKLPVGSYRFEITADGYFSRTGALEIAPRRDVTAVTVLYARPSRPMVVLTPKRLLFRRALQFVPDSAVLKEESFALLAESAELLRQHPEITQVEVRAHLDNLLGEERAQQLSDERANAVRDWLVAAGVEPSRVTAIGFGATRPLGPNITAQNRARNRRIEIALIN